MTKNKKKKILRDIRKNFKNTKKIIRKIKRNNKKTKKKTRRVRSGLKIWSYIKSGVKVGYDLIKMPFEALSMIGTGISYVITGLAVALFSWANFFMDKMGSDVSNWFDIHNLGLVTIAYPLNMIYKGITGAIGTVFDFIIGDASSLGGWIIDNPGFDALLVGGIIYAGAKTYSAIKSDIKKSKRNQVEEMKKKLIIGKEKKYKLAESDKKIIEGMIEKYEKEIKDLDQDEEITDEEIEQKIEEGFHGKISQILSLVDKKAFKEEDFRNKKTKNILGYLKNTNKGKDNKVNWLEVKNKYKDAVYKFNTGEIREKLDYIKLYT